MLVAVHNLPFLSDLKTTLSLSYYFFLAASLGADCVIPLLCSGAVTAVTTEAEFVELH